MTFLIFKPCKFNFAITPALKFFKKEYIFSDPVRNLKKELCERNHCDIRCWVSRTKPFRRLVVYQDHFSIVTVACSKYPTSPEMGYLSHWHTFLHTMRQLIFLSWTASVMGKMNIRYKRHKAGLWTDPRPPSSFNTQIKLLPWWGFPDLPEEV